MCMFLACFHTYATAFLQFTQIKVEPFPGCLHTGNKSAMDEIRTQEITPLVIIDKQL